MIVDIRAQENKFVKSCQKGDAAAWEQLVARHTPRVYRICYRFTRRDCEARDMTQEVFMRVFRTLGSFRAEELSFVAWLNVVTRNLLRDHYRGSRRDRLTVAIDSYGTWIERIPHAARGPDQILAGREASRILESALSKLPADLRETIILYDVQELQYREIACRLGIPIGTVKSRLNRGRAMLAHLLRRHKLAA